MSYQSNLPAVTQQLHRARAAGLVAAAAVVVEAVKDGIRGGFTSGDFDTGESVEHVQRSGVTENTDGAEIRVGTDLVYNLVWELGHLNVFTRKFERKEVWLPTLHATRAEQLAAFRAAHRQSMGAG